MSLFERRLLYYLRRLTGDEQEAWDILQQTWLKVLRGIQTLRQPGKFKSWVYSVARHTASSRFRSCLRENTCQDNTELENIPGSDTEPEAFDNADLVHYGLGKLPLEAREILTLFFLEGFSLAEIGEILELPEGTVKSRMHRAKHALKVVLTREGGQS